MAVREIKTTLALDGEQAFSQAIQTAERNLRVLGSELKAAGAEFEQTGNRQDFLEAKSRTLSSEIGQQEKIIKALGQAVSESAAKYGEADKRTDGYRIKLNNAEAALSRMKKQLDETGREAKEFGTDSTRVGRQIEEGIEEGVKGAEGALDSLMQKMQEDIGSIKGSVGFSALVDGGGFVADTFGQLNDFAESTRGERRSQSFMKNTAQMKGLDPEFIKGQWLEIAGVTGETDGAYEGMGNLMMTGFDASEITAAIDMLAGAVISFPDTMKFESLAESLQETVAAGSATGQFAELVGRLAGEEGLEKLNDALGAAATQEERQQVALSFLNSLGLIPAYESYKKNNEELIRAETATIALDTAISQFGKTVDQVLTPVKETAADALTGLTLYLEGGYKALADAHEMTEEAFREETSRKTGSDHTKTRSGWGDFGKPSEWFSFDEADEAFGNILGDGSVSLWDRLFGDPRVGKEKAKGTVDSVQNSLLEEAEAGTEDVKTSGTSVGEAYGDGIAAAIPQATGQALAFVNSVNGTFAGIQLPSIGGVLNGLGGGMNTKPIHASGTTVAINIDSRKVAQAVVDPVSRYQGESLERSLRYNA